MQNEMWTPFDTEQYGVLRCHFLRRPGHDGEDRLSVGDFVIFNFHQGSFDGRAVDLFMDKLKLGYASEQQKVSCLQYIDYSVHKRALPMIEARNYWREALRGYAWGRQLDLGAI
jgi:hypothetical protein